MARPSPNRAHRGAELAAALILAGGVTLGFATAGLPSVAPATGAPTRVSAQRALADLQAISHEPHPVGTVAHDRVRDYLVDRLHALGCRDVHVQSAVGYDNLAGPLAATVANVACRLRGTTPGRAVLLTAHYDAVPRGLGAGDDGAGVAAILEVVRALGAAPPLSHDLIVLFSDAEEEGLLGAEAFVDLHPWARDVATVLNFDARGDAGPVYMFQTSRGNAALITALAQVRGARANSLTGEVYRHLPNDTDLSIWLHARPDVSALNFADVDGYTRYHTPIDNIAHLDLRVVQHMADYAIGLVRALDTTSTTGAHDAVYFNAPWVGLVRYPESWALPLMLLTALLLGFVVMRRGRVLHFGAVASGFAVSIGLVLVPMAVTWAGWRILRAAHPGYTEILQGDPYNSRGYLLAAACAVVALVMAFQQRARHHGNEYGLAAGAAVLWAIAGVVVAIVLPGASYLFQWPLLGAVLALALWRVDRRPDTRRAAAILACALPALVLWPPLIRALEIGLTAAMLPACGAMLALATLAIALPLSLLGSLQRPITRLVALAALVALVVAEARAGFSAARPRPDSLLLLRDGDSQRAWWVSFDATPDSWTRPALGEHPVAADFSSYRFPGAGRPLLSREVAQGAPDTSPEPLRVVSDSATADGHRLRLHLEREGNDESITLFVTGDTVRAMTINGRALIGHDAGRYGAHYAMGPGGEALRYFGVPEEGLDLTLDLAGHAPLTGELVTSLPGWTGAHGPDLARPAGLMSKPFVPTDVTLTRRQLRLVP